VPDLAHKICPKCETRASGDPRFCPSCGTDLSGVRTSDGDPYLGLLIQDRYRIDKLIGAGAMGRVYRAEQTALHKPFAVKILSPHLTNDPDSQARFANEAHNAASLNHPNVVSIVDYGRTRDNVTYLVMEYVEGRSLEQIIADEHPLARARVVDLTLQILAALTEAHGLGILHRDLKPENILIQSLRDRGELLKVLDFGIAKLMDESPNASARPGLTSQGIVCGTPEYMSPEQACGLKLDQRSDLYAVGVILYQMMTGRPPFESHVAVEILHRHIHEQPKPPSAVLGVDPDPLEAVCLKALAKERDHRFANATEFREALLEATRAVSNDLQCKHCGEPMRANARFCASCGTPVPDAKLASGIRRPTPHSTRDLRQVTGESTAEVLLRALPQRMAGRAPNERLAAWDAILSKAEPGSSAQVIAGPPGSGKTRLLDEAASRAEARGWMVISAAAESTGAMTALWPIRVAVAKLLQLDHQNLGPADLQRAASLAGLSYEALPGLAELFGFGAGASVEYAVRRRECLTSAVQVLTEAGNEPLLLLFDDVDRWDAPSRRIVQRLVRAQASRPMLVLIATSETNREWLGGSVIELEPLSAEEVQTWAGAVSRLDSPLARRLAGHAPLTPFELELVLRCLPSTGARLDVEASLTGWLGRLAGPERQVLELASVLGEVFERDDLDSLRAVDPLGHRGSLDHQLSGLQQSGLIAPLGEHGWMFRNRRIRDHLLGTLERQRSRHLHREAATRSLRAQSSSTVRALYLLRAQSSRVEDAAARLATVELIEALREAAVTAVDSFDDPKAVRLLRTALKAAQRLPFKDRQLHESNLIAELVDPFCFTDRVEEAIATLRTLLEDQHPPNTESELQRALGRCLVRVQDWTGAVAAFQRALAPMIAQGRRQALLELYADLGKAFEQSGKRSRALAELSEGLDMCTLGDGPRADVDASMWRYLSVIAEIHLRAGDDRSARIWIEHALFQAERRREDLGLLRCHHFMGRLLRSIGQPMLADQHFGRALEAGRKLGDRRTCAEIMLDRGDLRRAGGKPDDARRFADEAKRLAVVLEWQRGIDEAEALLTKLG
jgi:serine/threonine protein kinase/tetratricopeptide (TPR) repeat protein